MHSYNQTSSSLHGINKNYNRHNRHNRRVKLNLERDLEVWLEFEGGKVVFILGLITDYHDLLPATLLWGWSSTTFYCLSFNYQSPDPIHCLPWLLDDWQHFGDLLLQALQDGWMIELHAIRPLQTKEEHQGEISHFLCLPTFLLLVSWSFSYHL